ncbi:MAG: TIM barrel protein [Bacteroidota bacterium]
MLPAWLTDTFTPNLDRALHYTLQWGLEGVVLRTVGGPADRVPHVNEARLKRRLAEHDLPAVAIAPGLFEAEAAERGAWMNDLALLGEAAAFCARIGCPRVLVGALPGDTGEAADVLRRAGDRAARRGCALAVCNEAGGRSTGRALADLLAAVEHPAVRACWSPAEAEAAGESAAQGLAALAGRIEVVLMRDGDRAERAWPEVLGGLHAAGFDGVLCLELREAAAAADGLRAATALIHAARAARRR